MLLQLVDYLSGDACHSADKEGRKSMASSCFDTLHPLEEQGFIEHGPSHPLVLRRRPAKRDPLEVEGVDGHVGVSFLSEQYVPAGTRVWMEIPASDSLHRFDGTVVFVRETEGTFQIGVWLDHAEDTDRLQVVEEICALEDQHGIRPRIAPTPANGPTPLERFRDRALMALHQSFPRGVRTAP
jgi:hypothetical protein